MTRRSFVEAPRGEKRMGGRETSWEYETFYLGGGKGRFTTSESCGQDKTKPADTHLAQVCEEDPREKSQRSLSEKKVDRTRKKGK